MKFVVTATKVVEFSDALHRVEETVIADAGMTLDHVYKRLAPFESLRIVIPVGELVPATPHQPRTKEEPCQPAQ